MKTNEVEKQIGLSKQTLLFYEREGLIKPNRDSNGYRNYNDHDIQLLLLIKFLRSMEIGIDDIKLIISQQISFKEVLETQSHYIDKKLEDIKEVKAAISFYKEKNIPMIPALKELDTIQDDSFLGYQKTTQNISIGRKLTQKYSRTKLLLWMSIAFIIALLFYIMKHTMIISIIAFVIVLMIQILCYGLGLSEMKFLSIDNNASKFMEFNEKGISYISDESFNGRMSYFFNVIRGIESLEYVDYKHISKVTILRKERYMKIPGSELSTHIETYDYCFEFDNHKNYYLINPMFIDNDREIVNTILREKVKMVVEK